MSQDKRIQFYYRCLCLVSLVFTSVAFADLNIFDVRKNIAMSDSDPVYRDYYINGGSEAGLTLGMVLTVQRRLPLYDSYQNRSAGDLQLKVAKVKIIHVQRGLAVARLHSEFTRENAPMLEDNFIMIGDRLDIATASSDKKAEADSTAPASSPAPAAAPSSAPAPTPTASPTAPPTHSETPSSSPASAPTATSPAPAPPPEAKPENAASAAFQVQPKEQPQILVNAGDLSTSSGTAGNVDPNAQFPIQN